MTRQGGRHRPGHQVLGIEVPPIFWLQRGRFGTIRFEASEKLQSWGFVPW